MYKIFLYTTKMKNKQIIQKKKNEKNYISLHKHNSTSKTITESTLSLNCRFFSDLSNAYGHICFFNCYLIYKISKKKLIFQALNERNSETTYVREFILENKM